MLLAGNSSGPPTRGKQHWCQKWFKIKPQMFSKLLQKKKDLKIVYGRLPYKEEDDLYLGFAEKKTFNRKTDRPEIRETKIRDHLHHMKVSVGNIENKNASNGKEPSTWVMPINAIYAVPDTYDGNAHKESRRSTMDVYARLTDGHMYPTTMSIDPYSRKPTLSPSENSHLVTDHRLIEEISSEEIPRMNTRTTELKLQNDITKPGVVMDKNVSKFNGRNILNLDEAHSILAANESTKIISIPVSDVTDYQMRQLARNMLLNTVESNKNIEHASRQENLNTIQKVLIAFGFQQDSWNNEIRVMVDHESQVYGKGGAEQDKYVENAKKVLGNIFQTPVFVDKGVIDKKWSGPSTPQETNGGRAERLKRPIGNVTIFESESKTMKEDLTVESIGIGIQKLAEIAGQILSARGESRKGILIEEHEELASDLLARVSQVQSLNDKHLNEIRHEKDHVKRKMNEAKKLIETYETEIVELEGVEKELKGKIHNINEELQRVKDRNGEVEEENASLKLELEAKTFELEKYIAYKKKAQQEHEENRANMQEELDNLTEQMDISLQIKEDITQKDNELTRSIRKTQKKFKQCISPVPECGLLNPAFLSDSEEDSAFKTPQKTFNKSNHSIASMTLTPSKIGLKPWDSNLQNFSQWFSNMRMPIEAAKQTVQTEKAVIRLILMCIPNEYSWIVNTIADDTSITTIDKAKEEILKLLYGDRGLLQDFFKIKMNHGEHPMTFLQRMKTTLETTEDLNSGFVLRSIEELLQKNLDQATNIEFQRLIKQISKGTMNFEKLKTALKTAVSLTGNGGNVKDSQLNRMGTEILDAINAMNRRCHNCGEEGHFIANCPRNRRKYSGNNRKPNKNKEAYSRESKSKKDGRSDEKKRVCYRCKKPGHIRKDCPSKQN